MSVQNKWLLKVERNMDLAVLAKLGEITYVSEVANICKTICFTTHSTKDEMLNISGVKSVTLDKSWSWSSQIASQ